MNPKDATTVLIQLSPKRHLIVTLRTCGVTGGTIGGTDYRNADILFGPASWRDCWDFLHNSNDRENH